MEEGGVRRLLAAVAEGAAVNSQMTGKRILITGGGRGIGRQIAIRLAAAGAKVVVAARTKAQVEAVARETGGEAVELDLADERSIAACAKAAGRVDVLVNNAAAFGGGNVVDLPLETWDRIFDTNLRGTFLMTKAILPQMIERRSGDIVIVSSTAAKRANAGSSAYSASKHGLNGFAEALLREVRQFNVRVIAVSPSAVELPERGAMRANRLQAGDVADAVVAALALPGRALVRDIELWATNP